MATLPPRMQRLTAKIAFSIPPTLRDQLLPSPSLSIRELSDFKLPTQHTSAPSTEGKTRQFFCNDGPESTHAENFVLRLRLLPIPDTATIMELSKLGHKAFDDGSRSVCYAHIQSSTAAPTGSATRFPLWAVTYWKELLDVKPIVARWRTSRDWLRVQIRQRKSAERQSLAEEANILLTLLPWGMDRPKGISIASEPIHSLWRYLGPHWLGDPEIDESLDILREHILSSVEACSKIRVENVFFAPLLLGAYNDGEAAYMQNPKYKWLRDVGGRVGSETLSVATIAHLRDFGGGEHWVSLVMKGNSVHYGDSLQGQLKVPETLKRTCSWWLKQHQPSHVSAQSTSDSELVTQLTLSETSFSRLPITSQSDGHSCGILAINAIDHFVDAERYPLLTGQMSEIVHQRLKRFVTVATSIVDRNEATPAHDSETPVSTSGHVPSCEDDISIPLIGALAKDFEFSFGSESPVSSCDSDLRNDLIAEEPPISSPISLPCVASRYGISDSGSPQKRRISDSGDAASSPLRKLRTSCMDEDRSEYMAMSNGGWDSSSDTDWNGKSDADVPGPSISPSPSIQGRSPTTTPVRVGKDPVQVGKESSVRQMKSSKLTSYWSVSTPAEKQASNEKEFQIIRDQYDAMATEAKVDAQRKVQQGRILARERQQAHRDRSRDKKIAEGWIPGQKRKRTLELEAVDKGIDSSSMAELSRPRRQYKEDQHSKKKRCGRKRQKEQSESKRVNWFSPFLWSLIEEAVTHVGKPWSPHAIVVVLHSRHPQLFSRLREQVVGRWIDAEAKAKGESRWSDKVLERVRKGNSPGGETTRVGILAPYPDLVNGIRTQLTSLRDIGVALSILTTRAIMVASIQVTVPNLFSEPQPDGRLFKCSDTFVRSFLHRTMGWSERRATKAAQKTPEDHEEILMEAFIREAYIVRDHAIPAALRVNTDQTQTVYQQGTQRTWTKTGEKQVCTVGQEEKRAFTLVPSISASGVLLPMQAVFMGKTSQSCPKPTAPRYAEAKQLGFRLLPSKTSTYWSTLETMQDLVNHIIAPYFDTTKQTLGLPPSQCSIWKIDCWSVHKSEEFLTWMKTVHPNIIIIFVPGGCTGIWQPLDVGIQRVMKLSMKRSAHRDVVDEVTSQLKTHEKADVRLDVTLGTLRDRAVGWMVNAFNDINDKALICKAFEMCRVGAFNLSHTSITSPEALAILRNLHKTNPALFDALSGDTVPLNQLTLAAEEPFSDATDDDSDIPLDALKAHLGGCPTVEGFDQDADGSLIRTSTAEDIDFQSGEAAACPNDLDASGTGEKSGKQRRKRKAPVPFGGEAMWETN